MQFVEGPFLAHLHIIFDLFWQTYDLLQNEKTLSFELQKLSAKVSKGGPEMTASFAYLSIHPWLYA